MVQPGFAEQMPTDVGTLMRRIEATERQLRELGPSVAASFAPAIADLQAQQATLTAQQASLTTAVANIATLVSQQVSASVATTATTTTWTTATSYASMASTSVTVPSGYTQGLIVGIGSTVFQDSAPNSFQSRVVIGGSTGTELNGLANLNAAHTPIHSAVLTGLSGSVAVSLQVKSGVASAVTTGRIAQVSAFAIFFR